MNITALADCPLDINPLSYSCTNLYPNCTNPASFQFASLWLITQAIAACPNDTRLFPSTATSPALTNAACQLFTHKQSWTPYPAADIWARLTTWKFPLLQLVAVFPRPPLTLLAELFVLVHLLGDPISTISALLLKVASCQSRAEFWKVRFEDRVLMGHLFRRDPASADTFEDEDGARAAGHRDRRWKGLAAIVDSFDEWGTNVGTVAEGFILDRLTNPDVTEKDQMRFLELCRLTANALAADRSTKFLPIIVAQGFFIGTIAIAFGRTKDSAAGPNPPTFINIEAHSIAFSSLYFWIIPAVIISSIIGVSQTEDAIPRILRRFSNEVHAEFPEWFPEWEMRLPHDNLTTELREKNGGIYSWQPEESRNAVKETILRNDPDTLRGPTYFPTFWQRLRWLALRVITLGPGSGTLAFTILIYSALTGILISWLVPPVGFDCRHVGELLIALAWILSAFLNNLPIFPHLASDDEVLATRARRKRFLFILWKDILITIATMGGIIFTQIGVFNQCACYTIWGRAGLALPENDSVSKTLFWRINTSYPAIAFICVGFQLIIVPYLLLRQYGLAVRVFLQRDDEKSNLPSWMVRSWGWLKKGCDSMGEGLKRMRKRVGRKIGRLRGRRTGILTPEHDAAEYLAPGSTWISKSGESSSYGEISVEMDQQRRSHGSDGTEPARAYFPR